LISIKFYFYVLIDIESEEFRQDRSRTASRKKIKQSVIFIKFTETHPKPINMRCSSALVTRHTKHTRGRAENTISRA